MWTTKAVEPIQFIIWRCASIRSLARALFSRRSPFRNATPLTSQPRPAPLVIAKYPSLDWELFRNERHVRGFGKIYRRSVGMGQVEVVGRDLNALVRQLAARYFLERGSCDRFPADRGCVILDENGG
jgi:hypothetical protein